MARLIYTQRRVPTYAELSAWVPGSLLGGPPLEWTQWKCEEAQPRAAEVALTITGVLCVHDSASITALTAQCILSTCLNATLHPLHP